MGEGLQISQYEVNNSSLLARGALGEPVTNRIGTDQAEVLLNAPADDLVFRYFLDDINFIGATVTELGFHAASSGLNGPREALLEITGLDVSVYFSANLPVMFPLRDAPILFTGNIYADSVSTGYEDDLLNGRAGRDTLNGSGGNDTLLGGSGADRLIGDMGQDRLNGGRGNDRLDGGVDNDRLVGGTGRDLLIGGFGNDRLYGQAGADRLDGGQGRDILNAGVDGDRDMFIYRSVRESRGDSIDRLNNFDVGEDLISLRPVDARNTLAGNQEFAFSESGPARYAVWVVETASGSHVRADTSGDRRADMAIFVAGVSGMGADDFIL